MLQLRSNTLQMITIDDNDFSVAIMYIDSEATENDGLRSASYKKVGDNIDKNFTPSFQRLHHQTKSVRYFHAFAVEDHIDLSDSVPHKIKINPTTLLPGPADLTKLLEELQIIVTR